MITLGLRRLAAILPLLALLLAIAESAPAQDFPRFFLPGQSRIDVRDPAELPHLPIPDIPPPATVSNPETELPSRYVSLDEAIRIALANSEVVRVLAGVSAASSGQTIYDTAIDNNKMDEQQSRFDPTLTIDNIWNRVEQPGSASIPLRPNGC